MYRLTCFFLLPLLACGQESATPPVAVLKQLAFGNQSTAAKSLFELERPSQDLLNDDWLEAMSWVGRAGLISGDLQLAEAYASETLERCRAELHHRTIDKDPEAAFPIALGAAIETLGKVYVASGDRTMAVSFLQEQIKEYSGTSIETRLNKNLLLLSLEGKPIPSLDTGRFLETSSSDMGSLKGKVVLLFFWAHWCGDCLTQKPLILELEEQYAPKGLRLVAPTQLYGYVARGMDASAEQELAYLQGRFWKQNPLPEHVPIPLSSKKFVAFGVSTTPTLVLNDRKGIVRLYHPGSMSKEELEKRIKVLLDNPV